MNLRSAAVLAALAVLGLAAPGTASAANVGYYAPCYSENPSTVIAAAGHTPVQVSTLDSASLAGLGALVLCNTARNAAVDTAVFNGMALISHDPSYTRGTWLPGTTGFTSINSSSTNVDFPAGSPIVAGPGGLLNDTSLDNGNWSIHGAINAASIPAGAQVLAIGDDATRVVTLSYGYGAGSVVYSTIPLGCYLHQGGCESLPVSAGMKQYATNVIAWAAGPGFTTCAAAGYTGTKLTLCRKICEADQPTATLSALVKLWISAYRTAPGCAI